MSSYENIAIKDHKVFLMPEKQVASEFPELSVSISTTLKQGAGNSKKLTMTLSGIKFSGNAKPVTVKHAASHEKIVVLQPKHHNKEANTYTFSKKLSDTELEKLKADVKGSDSDYFRFSLRGTENPGTP